MATNQKLRTDLLKHLDVTPQRISQRVKRLKNDHGPMTTEDATYMIAHQEGLDLTNYLDSQIVDRVRTLIQRSRPNTTASDRENKKGQTKPPVVVRMAPGLPQVDAYLSTTIANDARKMAEVYPKYYVLENSMRIVIKRILENSYGKQWWQTKVAKPARDAAANRIAREAEQPWHGKRGQHEIFYSDFRDLKKIITKNWSDFQNLFPTQAWIIQRLEELEHPRNVMAHHNPISKQDQKRMEVYFDDWVALLKAKKNLLP